MKKVLLDTNVLVLFIVGHAHPKWIGQQKPVSDFTDDDFVNLMKLLEGTITFVGLPNILTEVSNHFGFGRRNTATTKVAECFESFCQQLDEIYVESDGLVRDPSFRNFGLTDSAILSLRRADVEVITVDFGLHGKLLEIGVRSQNLRNLYELN